MDARTLIDPSKPILTLFSTKIAIVPEHLRLLLFKEIDEAVVSGTIRVILATGETKTLKVRNEHGITVD